MRRVAFVLALVLCAASGIRASEVGLQLKVQARRDVQAVPDVHASYYGNRFCTQSAYGYAVPMQCQTYPGMSQSACNKVIALWNEQFAYCCPYFANFLLNGPNNGLVPTGGYALNDPGAMEPLPTWCVFFARASTGVDAPSWKNNGIQNAAKWIGKGCANFRSKTSGGCKLWWDCSSITCPKNCAANPGCQWVGASCTEKAAVHNQIRDCWLNG